MLVAILLGVLLPLAVTSVAHAAITSLTVNDTANAADWSVQTNLQAGNTQYGDRTFTLTSVPSTLTGSSWIRTANDSKNYTSSPTATFVVTAAADVYVGHNDLITTKPSWLTGWTDSGLDLVNSESPPRTFSLFRQAFAANATVTLGPNSGGGNSMYTVIVKDTAALVTSLTVNDTANAADWSVRTNLQAGNTQYGDRTFTLTTVPSTLAGSSWIRTANDSKTYTSSPVATFVVTQAADVYVGHNDLITPKPSWLTGWTDSGLDLVNSESPPRTFSLYRQSFAANATITLGPNGSTGSSMYTVVVTPAAGPAFSDDFESYTIGTFPSAKWTNATGEGTWAIQSDGTKVLNQSAPSATTAVLATGTYTDFTLEARVKLTSTANETWTGLVGRYTDENNWYMLWLNNGNTIALDKRVGGSFTLLQTASFTYTANTWYTLKLVFTGTSIKGFVNGVERLSVTDSSLASGRAGARGLFQSYKIDDVVITTGSGSVPSVPLWGMFEGSVVNSTSYANPFTGTTLNVTYTAPTGGRTVSFWGFHDGGTIWRFRFMPDEAGTWTYSATFSDGAPGTSGSFVATATGARRGPLIADTTNTRWYTFKGSGEHFIPRGYYYLDAFADFDGTWQSRIDSHVVNNGMNLLQPMTWVRGRTTTGEIGQSVDPVYAWQMSGSTVVWDKYDLTSWQKIDAVVAYAEARNIVVYVFDGFFPNIGTLIPTANEEPYLRYALARLAPRWNMLWNITFEWQERYTTTKVNGWGNLIQSLDPWDHLITAHGWSGNFSFPTQAWAGYQALQTEFRIPFTASEFVQTNYNQATGGALKPVFCNECLWEDLNGDLGKPRNGVEVRKGGWGLLLGGGNYVYADWTADFPPTRAYGNGEGWPYVKIMYDFLQSRSYWLMSPNNALLTSNTGKAEGDKGVVLRQAGQEYLVYTPVGVTLTLNLAETTNTFNVTWFNPRTAATQSGGTVVGGASRTFTPPDSNDWTLQLVRQ